MEHHNKPQQRNYQHLLMKIIKCLTPVYFILVSLSSHAFITIEGLSTATTPASHLRNLCLTSRSSGSAVALPGVHDALSAKIFAECGAPALFLSGFGVTASRLGLPDAGIITSTEMEDAAKCVISALNTSHRHRLEKEEGILPPPPPPLMVDGDTGYGGAANIRRTIRGLASAGAAAVTIEDQTFPKRCTYAAGVGVSTVTQSESIARIKTAIAARDEAKDIDGREILLVARTDCRLERGLDEVMERCKIYEALGADIVYAENLQSRSEYETLKSSLKEKETLTMLAQLQQRPEDELFTIEDVNQMGYDLALFGVSALQYTVGALQNAASEFLSHGGIISSSSKNNVDGSEMASFEEVKRVVGFTELDDFESKYYNS